MIKLGKREDTLEVKEFQQKFLKYGFHLVRLTKMDLVTASTGTVKVQCYLETKPVGGDFEGFKEQDGTVHEGLIVRADLGIHFDKADTSRMESNLTVLAAELGFTNEELKSLEAETIEEFLVAYTKMVEGKYFWIMLKAKEWLNNKGKINLKFAIFEEYIGKDKNDKAVFQIFCRQENFVEDTEKDDEGNIIKVIGHSKEGKNIGKQRSKTFDKTSKYHYEALPQNNDEADKEDDDDNDVQDNNSF